MYKVWIPNKTHSRSDCPNYGLLKYFNKMLGGMNRNNVFDVKNNLELKKN